MNENNQTHVPPVKASENVLAGIVGAFLFSLAGGILWFVLDRIGFVAGISGIVGVIAANRGYTFFAKGSSKKGIIVSTVIAILVLVIAWYLCFSLDLLNAYEEWYANGEVDYMPTYFECVANGYLYFEDSELAFEYIKYLLIGLALAIVASIPTFKQLMQKQELENQASANAEYTYTAETENTAAPSADSADAPKTENQTAEEPKTENVENSENN